MRSLLIGLLVLTLGCSTVKHVPDCGTRGPAVDGKERIACGPPYGVTAPELTLEPHESTKLTKFRQMLHKVLKRNPAPVKLKNIEADALVNTKAKAERILDLLLNPESALSRELGEYVQSLGGISSPALWNVYFGAYDRIVAFSDGYLTLFQTADRLLPKTGTIGDFGAGSGNGCSVLAAGSPGRKVLAMDHSADGLAGARKKLELVTNGDTSRFEIRQMDITKEGPEANSLDNAIMNNVLYTIAAKEEMLARIFKSLKSGGTFILNDPSNVIKRDPARLRQFLGDVIFDAVRNNAPVTEFDVALVGAINVQVLMGPRDIFLAPEVLQDLVIKAGFEIKDTFRGYYGASTYLLLRKP
jgi:SAM-dependent methyltransferase